MPEILQQNNDNFKPEFIAALGSFYKSTAQCVRNFRELDKDNNPFSNLGDLARDYKESYEEVADLHQAFLKDIYETRKGANKVQNARLDKIVRDMGNAINVININHQIVKTKLESYESRRGEGGVVAKVLAGVSDLKEIASYGKGKVGKVIEYAGNVKRKVERGAVQVARELVPRPVRKIIGFIGQAGQDVQDFWDEVF